MQTMTSTAQYFSAIRQALDEVSPTAVEEFVALLVETAHTRQTIFLVGNGGSAATASHFACDLAKGARAAGGQSLRVIALTDNVPLITAWANDVAYEDVFAEQLRNLCGPGDLLIAISASGMSPNILRTAAVARQVGARVVALTGGGGVLGPASDIWLRTPAGCIEQVEDLHVILTHLVACQVRERL
jgi:D-sedoheptulose 7-phosphate isomerase